MEVKYQTFPGWKSDISSVEKFEDLPENCRKYVEFIEQYLGVPVEWIGNGPARESMYVPFPSLFLLYVRVVQFAWGFQPNRQDPQGGQIEVENGLFIYFMFVYCWIGSVYGVGWHISSKECTRVEKEAKDQTHFRPLSNSCSSLVFGSSPHSAIPSGRSTRLISQSSDGGLSNSLSPRFVRRARLSGFGFGELAESVSPPSFCLREEKGGLEGSVKVEGGEERKETHEIKLSMVERFVCYRTKLFGRHLSNRTDSLATELGSSKKEKRATDVALFLFLDIIPSQERVCMCVNG